MYKKIHIRQIIFVAIISLIINNPLTAQRNDDIDNEFKLAVSSYQSADYKEALSIFNKIAVQLPYNPKTTAAYVFIGKTYLQMGDFNSAKQYLQDFLRKYPSSEYIDEAHLALAKVFYSQEDYKKSFEYILNIVAKAVLPEYKNYADSLGEKLALNYLEFQELKNINDTTSDSSLKPYLLLLMGEKEQNAGYYTLASGTYHKLIDRYPDSRQMEKAERLIKQLENKK